MRQLALQLLAMLRGMGQSVDLYYHTSLRFDVCQEADSMKTLCAIQRPCSDCEAPDGNWLLTIHQVAS